MSDHALKSLGELRDALSETYSETTAIKLWDRALSAEAELAIDPTYSDDQRKLVSKLRTALTELMSAHRDGLEAQLSPVLVAIGNLEASIKRGSIGEDGFPVA